jgi:alanine racemase
MQSKNMPNYSRLLIRRGVISVPKYRSTWVEINLDNVAHNVREIKKRVGDQVCIMATVKGEGYGHGGYEVATVALKNGAEKLAVAIPDEGVVLRRQGIKAPILILGMSLPESVEDVVAYDLMQTLCGFELAKALSDEALRQGKKAVVNIKVDSGMNRIGVRPESVVDFTKSVMALPNIEVEGVFTHFASTYYEEEFAQKQFNRFMDAINALESAGIHIPYKHCSNSGAVVNFPHTYLNQVRPGSILTTPVKAQKSEMEMDLKYCYEMKSKVMFIHDMQPGESIGYNLVFSTDIPRKIAIVPVGWADGFPPDMTNRGFVLIHGQRCPIRGRVCMDQTMVDITDLDHVEIGDEVVVLGKQGDQEISHLEWSAIVGGASGGYNNHVVLRCLVSYRVPRVFIYNGKEAGLRVPLRPEMNQEVRF